jgi:hypothetical protein
MRRFNMSLIPAHVESTRQHLTHWVQAWVDYESCLQAAFQALTPFTVILLNDLVAEARSDEVWAHCPLCWSLKHAYQHGPTSSECPYWAPDAAERVYQRVFGALLGKAGSEPALRSINRISPTPGTLLAAALWLGRASEGMTHSEEAHARTKCIGLAAVIIGQASSFEMHTWAEVAALVALAPGWFQPGPETLRVMALKSPYGNAFLHSEEQLYLRALDERAQRRVPSDTRYPGHPRAPSRPPRAPPAANVPTTSGAAPADYPGLPPPPITGDVEQVEREIESFVHEQGDLKAETRAEGSYSTPCPNVYSLRISGPAHTSVPLQCDRPGSSHRLTRRNPGGEAEVGSSIRNGSVSTVIDNRGTKADPIVILVELIPVLGNLPDNKGSADKIRIQSMNSETRRSAGPALATCGIMRAGPALHNTGRFVVRRSAGPALATYGRHYESWARAAQEKRRRVRGNGLGTHPTAPGRPHLLMQVSQQPKFGG